MPQSNANEKRGPSHQLSVSCYFGLVPGRSYDCPQCAIVTHTWLQLYRAYEYTQAHCRYTCVDTYSMPPCILLPSNFKKDSGSRPCTSNFLYPSQMKMGKKMQLKLVLMEAVACIIQKAASGLKGSCPCFTDKLRFNASRSTGCFEEFF